MTPSVVEKKDVVGQAKNQRATAYNTMSFPQWNELVQKSNKIVSNKKATKRG